MFVLERNRARIFIIASAILWGTSFPAIRMGLKYISPIVFLLLRFVTASFIMLIILFMNNIKIDFRNFGGIIGLSGFLNALAYALQFIGQKYTYATNAALMINTSPIFTAIFAHFLLKEKLNKAKILGIIITFLGASIIILGAELTIEVRIIGDILCLTAGAIWGLYMTLAKRIGEGISELELITIWFLYTVLFSIILLPFEKVIFVPTFTSILVVLYTALICTILPFLLWFKALKIMEASTSSNYFILEILISGIVEAILMGLEIKLPFLIGALLVIIGIYATDVLGGRIR